MTAGVHQFGDFRLDYSRFELLRSGRSVRLERKPMELLILLASSDGRLVTREEIAKRLWNSDVFVDTEHGINTAIRKVRQVLGDDPDQPRYIQTVPGMGYRFIAPIMTAASAGQESAPIVAKEDSTETAAVEQPATTPATPTSSVNSPRPKLWFAVGTLFLLAIVLGAFTLGSHPLADRFLHRDRTPAINSIAVLPLDNLSGDPNQEYFADGMTDELITMLAKDSTLRITSRTSVMQYKGARKPLREIARALNVDAILEGSISRANGQVHMNLQLIRADADAHLWAESYDRGASDVADLPNHAAQEIASRLQSPVASPGPVRATSPEALDAYLLGKYFLDKREASKSAAYYQKAISIDPLWSQAYSGLARAYQSEGVLNSLPGAEAATKGEAAARRAIELDPQNGEAYSTLGLIQATFQWNWKDAEVNLKHGIALNPNSSEAEFHYVIFLDAVNRPNDAVAHMRRALELDPASFLMNRHLGTALMFARQYDEALLHLNQAEEIAPDKLNFVQVWASEIYELKGMQDKAVESLTIAIRVTDPAASDRLQRAYKRAGWNAFWETRMQMMLADSGDVCAPYDIGVNYIRLGKPSLAFPYLNRAIDQKCWAVDWTMVDPMLDKIRTDGRYSDLLKRLNLPY